MQQLSRFTPTHNLIFFSTVIYDLHQLSTPGVSLRCETICIGFVLQVKKERQTAMNITKDLIEREKQEYLA